MTAHGFRFGRYIYGILNISKTSDPVRVIFVFYVIVYIKIQDKNA